MVKRRTLLRGSLVVGSGAALGAVVLARKSAPPLTTLSGPTMGTYYQVKLAGDAAPPAAVQADVEAVLERIVARMSTYRADSELMRLNRDRGTAPVAVSAETLRVAEAAVRTGEATGGAFDPTVGPLVDVWGFGAPGRVDARPGDAAIADAAGAVGLGNIRLAPGAIAKSSPDTRIDLSGIAKGYAVDAIAGRLEALGVDDYLVDVGGELRAGGARPDGAPWRVGIERPVPGERSVWRVVALERGAIATSGDYRNFFVEDGRRYAHAIDPRTARPVIHRLASVSVVTGDAMSADALSTALMVMGPEEGYDLAVARDLAACFVSRTAKGLDERLTPAFARLA